MRDLRCLLAIHLGVAPSSVALDRSLALNRGLDIDAASWAIPEGENALDTEVRSESARHGDRVSERPARSRKPAKDHGG